jgi:acyl-CoA-binding protein
MFFRLLALFALSATALCASPELEARFRAALISAKDKSGPALDDQQKLDFYGLFKAATVGPCNTEAPNMLLNPIEYMKWDAWKQLGEISQAEAKARYVAMMDSVKPGWK